MNPRSVTFRAGRSASLLVEQVGISLKFSVGAKVQPAFTRDGCEAKLYGFKMGEVTTTPSIYSLWQQSVGFNYSLTKLCFTKLCPKASQQQRNAFGAVL